MKIFYVLVNTFCNLNIEVLVKSETKSVYRVILNKHLK